MCTFTQKTLHRPGSRFNNTRFADLPQWQRREARAKIENPNPVLQNHRSTKMFLEIHQISCHGDENRIKCGEARITSPPFRWSSNVVECTNWMNKTSLVTCGIPLFLCREILPIFRLIEFRYIQHPLRLTITTFFSPTVRRCAIINIAGTMKNPLFLYSFLLRHCQFLVSIKMQYLVIRRARDGVPLRWRKPVLCKWNDNRERGGFGLTHCACASLGVSSKADFRGLRKSFLIKLTSTEHFLSRQSSKVWKKSFRSA